MVLSRALCLPLIAALTWAGQGPAARAQGVAPGAMDHSHGAEVGEPGKPEAVRRTLQVKLNDSYFTPATLSVRPGETVRFILINEGELLHEFTIGTTAMSAEHQKEMAAMAEQGLLTPTAIDEEKLKEVMASAPPGTLLHNHPGSVLVKPGERKELIWKFPQFAVLEFACTIPGHYEQGMVGDFTITR